MDWMYLVYFLLAAALFSGCRAYGRGEWNEEYTSLGQSKVLQGALVLGVALHHMAQKSCAPWHKPAYIVHGLDFFVPIGYLFVSAFFFCSGLGLYKSLKTKPNYLNGFIRKRILPLVAAFYLSEFICLAVRLLIGQKMDALTVLWYASGLHMANENSWYLIAIPFFYLAFYFAFRFCRREGFAIFWVFVFTLAYTVFGTSLNHQSDWWMRGEWWYNSVLLFPLGLLFGKHEAKTTAFFKKAYWLLLPVSFAGIFLSNRLFGMVEGKWGYYNEWDSLMIVHRLATAASQWLVCIFFTAFLLLLMLKVRFGNRVLRWLGAMTLSFYLMHGIFVEMFGYNFLEVAPSITYIRNVPLYMLAVLCCSVPAALLFNWLWQAVTNRFIRRKAQ